MSGETEQQPDSKRKLRMAFRAGAACLWVVVLVLALEVGARFLQRLGDSRNPLVAFRRGLPCDAAAVAPFLKLRENASGFPVAAVPDCGLLSVDPAGIRLTDAARGSAERNASRLPLRPVPGETRRAALQRFTGLSEAERNAYALLHGELVCSLDANGRLVRTYGDYWARLSMERLFTTWRGGLSKSTVLRGFMHRLRTACRDAAGGSSGFVDLPAPGDDSGLLLMAKARLHGREVACLFFTAGEEGVRKSPAQPLPPDSPWEEPWFRYKSNLRNARGAMGSLLSTNNRGYHDSDFKTPKPAGTFRILCLGGSTTEEGASLEASYPNLLEGMLREAAPGTQVEVFNCGIAGITAQGHIRKLDEYLSFEPDLVLLHEGVNDLLEGLPDYWLQEPDAFWRNLFRHSCLVRTACPLALLPPEGALRRDLRRVVVDRLDALGRVFMSHGVPVAVCTIPFPAPSALSATERRYYDFDARTHWNHSWLSYAAHVRAAGMLNEELRAWCARDGVCLVALDRVFEDGYGIFTDLCHMDSAGVERKARAVMQALMRSVQP